VEELGMTGPSCTGEPTNIRLYEEKRLQKHYSLRLSLLLSLQLDVKGNEIENAGRQIFYRDGIKN
jgi:hypothetical protein